MSKTVLVIFGKDLPKKNEKWWQQFEKVIAPKSLKEKIQSRGADFINIESLTSHGSIQEANRLVSELPYLIQADGRRISKLVNWKGYELWWMNYDSIYYNFCRPYTQYQNLLLYLKDFDRIYLYQPPCLHLFQYFLKAHNCQCIIIRQFKFRNLLPLPFGIFLQLLISAIFLPWLKIKKPELMVWTSDKISAPYNFDFRSKSVFGELIEKKIPFALFMRSVEPWHKVLKNAWQRKRAVIYSSAIIELLYFISRPFSRFTTLFPTTDSEKHFWFLVAVHYLRNSKGIILSIRAMKWLFQWIGVKTAIIPSGCDRTFHEVLGCKLAGIKTVGIQHAAISKYAFVSDFMPGFTGERTLSVDKYGLWSEWWRDYYLKYSRAYNKGQLFISGPSNPAEKERIKEDSFRRDGPFKVLFISEQLAVPSEILPYLSKLLETKDFALSLKFRPYRDGFEDWLKEHRPDILKKVGIFREGPQQAAAESDVVVGSYSTAVLEALFQLKPIVFFRTNKWGDNFEIKLFDKRGRFFAENPEELINCIRKSVDVPKEDLKQLQMRFFGDFDKNGGKWVVEQAIKNLNEYKK